MRTHSLFFVLLLIWGGTYAARAQKTLPVGVDLDHAAFEYGEGEVLLETYLAFEAHSLGFQQSSRGYRARLPVYLRLVPRQEPSSTPVWTDSLRLSFSVPDTMSLKEGHHFVHQVRAAVPPGSYELVVEIPSGESGRREMMVRRQVEVQDFADKASLSDMILASSIRKGGSRQSPFYKNGLIIRPNPRRLYGTARSQLFYYAEAYNGQEIAGEDNRYTVHAYVSRTNQSQPVGDLTRQTKRTARSPDVLVGSFDVGELRSGSYELHLALLNQQGEAVKEQTRTFYVYSPGVEGTTSPRAAASSFEVSSYAALPEEVVAKELEQIRLIATAQEERRLDRLSTLDAKRRFLRQFWQKRDPDSSTPVNEYRRDFKQRVHFTNRRYGSNFSEGWETDRGYVLLKYGSPVDIQPRRYEQGMMPHEIWTYENVPGEGGQSTFVFADRDGFGRFELIHSTVDGERHMPDWRQRISR